MLKTADRSSVSSVCGVLLKSHNCRTNGDFAISQNLRKIHNVQRIDTFFRASSFAEKNMMNRRCQYGNAAICRGIFSRLARPCWTKTTYAHSPNSDITVYRCNMKPARYVCRSADDAVCQCWLFVVQTANCYAQRRIRTGHKSGATRSVDPALAYNGPTIACVATIEQFVG
jgi:hypothetical protein